MASLCRNWHRDHVPTELFHDDVVFREVRLHPVDVRVREVDLVDRDDQRHVRRLHVANGFDGLRHHTVVGGNDKHCDVGYLCAAGTHGGERRVAGSVDEGNELPVALNLVRTDVLRDSASLAGCYLRAANRVQQTRLAVVDVTKNGYDGRARLQAFRRVDNVFFDRRFRFFNKRGFVRFDRVEAKVHGHNGGRVVVNSLGLVRHDPVAS